MSVKNPQYTLDYQECKKAFNNAVKSGNLDLKKKLKELITYPKKGIPLINNLTGFYKIKAGTYRIIYTIDDENKVVVLYNIGPRNDVYKELARKLNSTVRETE